MTQSVEDGSTRPVYYESRVIQLKLDEETLRLIDDEYDLMAENSDPEVIERSKRKLGQMARNHRQQANAGRTCSKIQV